MEASFEEEGGREKEVEAVNYAHACDDGGWGGAVMVVFGMSLAHDCTTFLFLTQQRGPRLVPSLSLSREN